MSSLFSVLEKISSLVDELSNSLHDEKLQLRARRILRDTEKDKDSAVIKAGRNALNNLLKKATSQIKVREKWVDKKLPECKQINQLLKLETEREENLFERALCQNYKCRFVWDGELNVVREFYDSGFDGCLRAGLVNNVKFLELMLWDMIEHYDVHIVEERELDLIRDIMIGARECLCIYNHSVYYEMLKLAFEVAEQCLKMRSVFWDGMNCVKIMAVTLWPNSYRKSRYLDGCRHDLNNGCISWEHDSSLIGVENECEEVDPWPYNIVDRNGNFVDDIESADIRRLLLSLLMLLKPRDRAVLFLRYGFDDGGGCTLEKVGDILHLTRERVRQIEKKAISRLQWLCNRRLGWKIKDLECSKASSLKMEKKKRR